MTALWFWAWATEQVLRPPVVADEGQLSLPEQVSATCPPTNPPTQVIQAPFVWQDTEDGFLKRRRAFGRRAGANTRHREAQLPDEVVAAIAEYCRDRPKAKNSEIAHWLQKNGAMKRLVALPNGKDMKHASLAKKISHVRPPRK